MSNNTIHQTISEEEWQGRVYGTSIVGTINFCGFTLSCLTIILTFTSELKLNKVNLMLANMVLASMLHTFMFVVPQNLFILYMERLPEGACGWLGYTFFVLAVQMIIFPPFLAVNRHIALYYSQMYERIYTTKNIMWMIVGSWILSALIPLPFQLGGKTGFDFDNSHCCIVVRDSFWWTVLYCFMILVPLIGICDGAMLYCNFKIYKKLLDHSLKQSLGKNVMSQNRELFYFMIADTIIPLIFHTMYHVAKVAYTFRQNETLKLFLPAFYSTAAAIRCLAILILLRPYRQAFKKILHFGNYNRVSQATTTNGGQSTVNGAAAMSSVQTRRNSKLEL
jgi:hypothetical protein